ncbi:hypothetical protein ACFVP0_30545 [Streptomyces cinereoruber]|uniref:hypothetical protein n=1 Tax=Streptomyces cinereoruber TaxID=67260 RepID=UPI0036A4197B
MARIRTIKPEAWESEDLASVDVTAMLTFFGLLTQADDSGRHRDHPAIIAGRLWALRPEHTPAHVAVDLEQLAGAGLVCRYTGCDGKGWLHIVTWDRHQKINRPSDSRLPRCPVHQRATACGGCGLASCSTGQPPGTEGSPSAAQMSTTGREAPGSSAQEGGSASAHGGLIRLDVPDFATADGTVTHATTAAAGVTGATCSESPGPPEVTTESAGQSAAEQTSGVTGAAFNEDSGTGSRILDPGSSRRGREAPAPEVSPQTVLDAVEASEWSAKRLMSEYVRGCSRRPPKGFLGHLGKEIRQLLDEGFEPEALRLALERLRVKGLHPSVLPSLVNEALNAHPVSAGVSPSSASGAGPWASASPAHTPYLNPSEPAGAFGVAP